MKDGQMGFYLIKFSVDNPNDIKYLTMWRHNLDIDDANMYICRGKNENGNFKELVVGYKTIGINTYNTVILDLSSDTDRGR